jgi:hypothetical protein
MSAKRMHEVRSAVHVRVGNTLLVKVFTDTRVRALYIFTNFQVPERLHRGPEFFYTYPIDYIINSSEILP